ncbi:MAG: oligosaccharide flippase family protein [Clostridium sp.]|uniref:oligosaccharide flippase family protein n=2 Tax=Clostridium TaxID=1485 RepID=UPI0025FEBD20|nr:oligosaccharide flippase family protein [uncultured Clostridium sp.]MCI6693186.1 oligosaccharide flippase family protein [Clostridium sp.]
MLKNLIKNNNMINNTIMLYLMTVAKIIFPLITLPYLTRILSVDSYGVVSFVKSYMVYIQLVVDFGFSLSSVKDIVEANNDKKRIGIITGQTILAKLILSAISLVATLILCPFIPLLGNNLLYTLLSFFVIFLSSFLMDFLFQGIEKMHVMTISFVIMKLISTSLTLVLVKSDLDILWIPMLDIISSIIAIIFTLREVHKYKISIKIKTLKKSIELIKESSVYFISNFATTAFGALNTLLIGIAMDSTQVAYWSVALQLIAAVNAMYSPIVNGIYPQMVREKSLLLIKKILYIFMPIVFVGCTVFFISAKFIVLIVSGEEYLYSVTVLRYLIPILLISFPVMVTGWPTLGAIGKAKETTITTTVTAVAQVLGLIVLMLINKFTLINVAILRCLTELLMLILRIRYCYIFSNEFSDKKVIEKSN